MALPPCAAVSDAVRYIRAVAAAASPAGAPDAVYVVDRASGELRGHVPLSALLVAGENSRARVGELLRENAVVVGSADSVGAVARAMAAAGLARAPVVEDEGRGEAGAAVGAGDVAGKLLGVVRGEDVARVAAGAGTAPYFATRTQSLIASRAPWLVGLLILQSASSLILGRFGDLIQRHVLLAFFLTTVVGAGGNSGSQSAAMLIVGLARGEIDEVRDFWRVLGREMFVAMILGAMLACVAFVRVLFLGGGTDVVYMSSITIALALLLTVMAASVMGSATPMVLKRFGVDPALGSGPALATLTDICGAMILCVTATLILGGGS